MSRPDTYVLELANLRIQIAGIITSCNITLEVIGVIKSDENYNEYATNKEKQAIHQAEIECEHTIDELEKIEWA
jgi:hypothetical protein